MERGPLAPSSTEDGNLPSRILRIADLKGSTRHVCLRAIGNFLTPFERLVRYQGYCNTNRNFYAEHKRASQTRSKPSPHQQKGYDTRSYPFCWCGRRELNPYGKTTRPSNVRVCQFRHSRDSFSIIHDQIRFVKSFFHFFVILFIDYFCFLC